MLVLGLTGGIGMGKSFVTDVLRKCGVPVLDADAEVRVLYAFGGDAVAPIRALFGDDVIGSDGGVDRDALAKLVLGKGNETNMSRLESLVHPLVNQRREGFLHDTFRDRNALVVLDLPLVEAIRNDDEGRFVARAYKS